MEENELYEVLGVTPAAQEPEGGNEQGAAQEAAQRAEPDGAQNGAGANEREPAEPAEEDENTQDEDASGEETPESADSQGSSTGEKMPDEERRRNAAERRARELREAQEQAREEVRKQLNDRLAAAFKKAGLKNPMKDNADITSLEELEEYQSAANREKADRELRSGKVTRETIEQVMEDTPQMQAIREMQSRAEQASREAQRARDEQLLDEQIEELKKLDPKITGRQELADALQDGETGAQMQSLVKRGLSFVEAWKLTHIDELTARAAAQERARTEKNIRGKEHLKATTAQGKGARAVPAGQMELFRAMCPNLTDRQIEEWYAKTYKE